MFKNVLTSLFVLVGLATGFTASAQIVLLVQEPSNLAGSYQFTYSSDNGWGADMDTVAISAPVAFAYDGSSADSLGCEDIVNTADIEGKIAVVYRGACNFSLKALNVQDSGAVALIIINNIPGSPVGMGAGTFGPDVTIPVAMISQADGALLRDSIMAGAVEIFLGNNTNLFANNVGSYKADIGMANSQSIPVQLAQSASAFEVPVATWVKNYGSAEAINVIVNAVITRDGSEIYNETSTGSNILSGDSLYFSLATYSENGYTAGLYTITYTISSDASDEFPDDNAISTSFWINEEGVYSKSYVDPVTGPVAGNGLRPANGTEYQWCITLQSPNAETMAVSSISFATLTNDLDLTGQAVQLSLYEWNDPFDGTATPTFDDLTELTDNEFYDYASDAQNEFVTHYFAAPIELVNDQKYLGCATIFVDNMFLGVDAGLDYNTTYDSYPTEIFFPLNDIDGGAWYSGGFGTDNVPAIIMNLQLADGIADDVEAMDVTPYPNPTTDMINIPLGIAMNGSVNVTVYDIEGRLVLAEELCQTNSTNIRMDVSQLSSGVHTFKLQFEDNSTTSFRVVVTR